MVDALGPDAVVNGRQDVSKEKPNSQPAAPNSPATEDDVRQKAIRRLMSNLTVAPVTRSNVIHVSYQSGSPDASQAVLARLMEIFLADYVRLQRPAEGADFLEKQAARMRTELRQTDDALQKLKSETEILSPEERRAIIAKRVGTLEDESLQTAGELAVAEAAAAELRSKLAGMSPTAVVGETQGIGDEGTNRMRDRFYALQIAEKEARAKFGEAHPLLQQILSEEAAARDILDHQQATRSQVTHAPDRAYEDLKLQLANREVAVRSLKSKAAALDAQLADARKGLRRFSEQEVQIARLERERDIQDVRYRKFAAVAEEARVDQDLQAQRMSNVSVFQPASFDPTLVLPRKTLNLAAALLVGLLGAAGIALIAETRGPRRGLGSASRRARDLSMSAARPVDGPRVSVVTSP